MSVGQLAALARDIRGLRVPQALADRPKSLARRLDVVIKTFHEVVTKAVAMALPGRGGGERALRLDPGFWQPPLVRDAYFSLDNVLDDIAVGLKSLGRQEDSTWIAGMPPAARLSKEATAITERLSTRAEGLRDTLGDICASTSDKHVCHASVEGGNVRLSISPIDVSSDLRGRFDAHPGPIVFTSATLSVDGDFEYTRRQLGLGDGADHAVFSSPFDYSAQSLLYVASDLPEASAPGFVDAAAERALELTTLAGGRALILCTSFRNLRFFEQAFRAHGGFSLLVQGQAPRHELLAKFRSDVGSVLLATQSFWEGVDVPGEALSLVVMDKLPFVAPDEPVVAARLAAIEKAGRDPFGELQLPQAALALKQGFGRLVRTQADRGVVAMLDGRLLWRGYGAQLRRSFPPSAP